MEEKLWGAHEGQHDGTVRKRKSDSGKTYLDGELKIEIATVVMGKWYGRSVDSLCDAGI